MTSTDVYCYKCNDAMLDPELAMHLSTFGINVKTLTKTEKSMTELVKIFSINPVIITLIFLSSKSNTT